MLTLLLILKYLKKLISVLYRQFLYVYRRRGGDGEPTEGRRWEMSDNAHEHAYVVTELDYLLVYVKSITPI